MSGPEKRPPDKKAKEEARKARLAAELRANLLKRKARAKSDPLRADRKEGRQR
jgi:hypothetical protein